MGSKSPKSGVVNIWENDRILKNSIDVFKAAFLASETSVRIIGLDTQGSCIDKLLDDAALESSLKVLESTKMTTLFINRSLVPAIGPWPKDANKLRLSGQAFDSLCSHLLMSTSFLYTLAHIQHPSPRAFPVGRADTDPDFWAFFPVRVQVQCIDQGKAHASSSKGRSQMNPSNYLHLPQPEVDIRGSKIAVYYLFNTAAKHASALVINFQDGRWKKVVEEPILRIRDIYRDCDNKDFGRDPFHLQIAVLGSILRWWNNSLNSFNDQLIAYEEALLLQDMTNEDLHRTNAEVNQSLHCMAAHLHRYGSELRSLSEIIHDMKSYNEDFHDVFVAHGIRGADALGRTMKTLDQVASHASVISTFRDELQQKIDNVLALLVDNTRAMNDQLLVQNSKAMQAILKATQAQAEQSLDMATQTRRLTEDMAKILQQTQQETEASRQIAIQSQRLSEEMMKDSVAMKTVALLTAFFLPGTSFAAILALPFFNDNSRFKDTAGIWIWIVATIPSTVVCFLFYFSWSRRELKIKREVACEGQMRLGRVRVV